MSDELLNFSITIGGIILIVILPFFISLVKTATNKQTSKKQTKIKHTNNLHSQSIITEKQKTIKCSKCGNVIEDETIFCDKCGARIL